MYKVSYRYSPDPTDRLVSKVAVVTGYLAELLRLIATWCHSSLHVYKVSYRNSLDPTNRLVSKVAVVTGYLAELLRLIATVVIVLYTCIRSVTVIVQTLQTHWCLKWL